MCCYVVLVWGGFFHNHQNDPRKKKSERKKRMLLFYLSIFPFLKYLENPVFIASISKLETSFLYVWYFKTFFYLSGISKPTCFYLSFFEVLGESCVHCFFFSPLNVKVTLVFSLSWIIPQGWIQGSDRFFSVFSIENSNGWIILLMDNPIDG